MLTFFRSLLVCISWKNVSENILRTNSRSLVSGNSETTIDPMFEVDFKYYPDGFHSSVNVSWLRNTGSHYQLTIQDILNSNSKWCILIKLPTGIECSVAQGYNPRLHYNCIGELAGSYDVKVQSFSDNKAGLMKQGILKVPSKPIMHDKPNHWNTMVATYVKPGIVQVVFALATGLFWFNQYEILLIEKKSPETVTKSISLNASAYTETTRYQEALFNDVLQGNYVIQIRPQFRQDDCECTCSRSVSKKCDCEREGDTCTATETLEFTVPASLPGNELSEPDTLLQTLIVAFAIAISVVIIFYLAIKPVRRCCFKSHNRPSSVGDEVNLIDSSKYITAPTVSRYRSDVGSGEGSGEGSTLGNSVITPSGWDTQPTTTDNQSDDCSRLAP